MDDLGLQQRHLLQQFLEPFPVQGLLAAASVQPVAPAPQGMVAYGFHRAHVAADSEVLKVASKLRIQDSVLLLHFHMSVLSTPLPKGLDGLRDLFPCRFAFDYPVPSPRLRPVVGESEKVECAFTPPALLLLGGPAEVDEAAFLWMDFQSELGEAFG